MDSLQNSTKYLRNSQRSYTTVSRKLGGEGSCSAHVRGQDGPDPQTARTGASRSHARSSSRPITLASTAARTPHKPAARGVRGTWERSRNHDRVHSVEDSGSKLKTRHCDPPRHKAREAAFTPTRKEHLTKGTLTHDTISQKLVPHLKNRHLQNPEQADRGGWASPPETRAGHGPLSPRLSGAAARWAVRQEEEREGVRLEPKKRNCPCLQMTYLST